MIPTEDELADEFERLVEVEFGIDLGVRERHDAAPGRLRVDFVYDTAPTDRVALEVTSIQQEDTRAQQSNLERLSDDLRCAAERVCAGSWHLDVTDRRWTAAERDAVRDWVVDQLEAGGDHGDVVVPDDMKLVGVTRLRRGSGDVNAVSVFGMGAMVNLIGFSRALLNTCVSNASKMSEAKPRTTHLLVFVAFLMGSRDVGSTMVPPRIAETDGIDFVWVVHQGDQLADERPMVWWARPGESTWNTTSR